MPENTNLCYAIMLTGHNIGHTSSETHRPKNIVRNTSSGNRPPWKVSSEKYRPDTVSGRYCLDDIFKGGPLSNDVFRTMFSGDDFRTMCSGRWFSDDFTDDIVLGDVVWPMCARTMVSDDTLQVALFPGTQRAWTILFGRYFSVRTMLFGLCGRCFRTIRFGSGDVFGLCGRCCRTILFVLDDVFGRFGRCLFSGLARSTAQVPGVCTMH